MDDPIPMTSEFEPEFQVTDAPPADPAPTVMPEYVTRQDLEAFAETLATKLAPQPVQPQTPQAPQTGPRNYAAEFQEKIFTDPAGAFQVAMEAAREEARKDIVGELGQQFAPMVLDYHANSATRGMDPLEAEYVQDMVRKGVLNAAAMSDPNVSDFVKRAAKDYANEKRANTPAPRVEESVGAAFHVTSSQMAGSKSAFDRFFGDVIKFDDAVKRIQ